MTRQILEQPKETEMPRTLNVVNLISRETYNGLRVGNVIGTNEGYVVKYSSVKDKSIFAGFLSSCRILEEFIVLSPRISGGVLDLRDSDIVKYKSDSGEEEIN